MKPKVSSHVRLSVNLIHFLRKKMTEGEYMDDCLRRLLGLTTLANRRRCSQSKFTKLCILAKMRRIREKQEEQKKAEAAKQLNSEDRLRLMKLGKI